MKNLVLLERIYSGRRAELKRIILNEALECFLKNGIETTQIEMIRERADTSVGAIYHHFKNKEGIVRALYFSALQDQAQRLEQTLLEVQSLEEVIKAIVHSYIDWVIDFPDFARFLYMSSTTVKHLNDSHELKQKNQQRNHNLMNHIQKFNDYQSIQNIPHELLLSLVIGATESYCRAWLSNQVKMSPQNYKSKLADSAWRSLVEFS